MLLPTAMSKLPAQSGRDFVEEDEILPLLLEAAPKGLLGPKGAMLKFTKFQVGDIIPDVLIIGARGKRQAKCTRAPLTMFDCAVIAELLKSGPSNRELLAESIYSRLSRIDVSLWKLLRTGLAVEEPDGAIRAKPETFFMETEIVAIEAKLTRWREALSQAKNYLLFANSAYVALPADVILRNCKIAEGCAGEGIGLISVAQGDTRVLLESQRYSPVSAERLWLLNKTAGVRAFRLSPAKVYEKLGANRTDGLVPSVG